MRGINRTLLLKRLVQIPSERNPPRPALDIHTSMKGVFSSCSTVWDRHWPRREKVTPGRRCVFLKNCAHSGDAVLFHAYSYVSGHTPDQAVLDELEEKISAEPITTEDGNPREIVERFAVIVLGEVMILESARVHGSGLLAVHAMRDLIRRHYVKKHPNFRIEDAPTLGFKHMVKVHGGVVKVTARLNSGFSAEPNTFGDAMEKLIAAKGFDSAKVSTAIEAPGDDELDSDKVEALLEESETGHGLSGISINFRDGTSLGDLVKYRERKQITVQEVRPGIPAVNEIEREMVAYLRSLAQVDEKGYQLITPHGVFT